MFDTDKRFVGKHAQYIHYLCKNKGAVNPNGINLFNRVIDLYITAPLIGLIYDRKGVVDRSATGSATIQYKQISDNEYELLYVFQLVMLLADKDKLTDSERLDRAFRDEADENKTKQNMELFDSYALGGIEVLYELFEHDLNSTSSILMHLFELLRLNTPEDDKILAELDELDK